MEWNSFWKFDATWIRKWTKSLKFDSPGLVWRFWATPLAPRWPKMRVGSHLGLNVETSWGSSSRQDGQSWAKMVPRWRYVGQLRAQDSQFGTIVGCILGDFSDLERDLSKNRRSVKISDTTTLFVFFWESGVPLEAPLGAILDDVGSKMVSFGLSWAMVWHLGAKMANKSAETRQDMRK